MRAEPALCGYCHVQCADHIEFDAQISASYSSREVSVQSVSDLQWLRSDRQKLSVNKQHQNVRLPRNRFHCRHCLPESAGLYIV